MQAIPSKNTSFHSTIFRANANTASIPPSVPLSRLTDNVLYGTSSVRIEELQKAWEVDPDSVDESGDNFFRNFGGQTATSTGVTGQTRQESKRLLLLIKVYQVNGHMKAKIDPPGLEEREIPDNMDPAFHGSTGTDLDREFFIELWNMPGFLADTRPMMTLRSILTRLEQAYCGSIGYEYMHINGKEKCNWLREKIETSTPMTYNRERREIFLDRLTWSKQFENFLETKMKAAKRFGLVGGETLIPGMKEMFDRASDLGVENIVVGMPHRGRLDVLGNVFRKPLAQISRQECKACRRGWVYTDAEIVWCQEEPMNMGASSYIAPRLCTAMKATGRGSWEDIKFVGRGPSASTATGFAQVHKSEQAEIVQLVMKPQPVKLVC